MLPLLVIYVLHCRYLFVVIFLTVISMMVNAMTFHHEDTGCIYQFRDYVYTALYPIILFLTIKSDSQYWWQFTSTPLLDSTSQSLQMHPLFQLSPYRKMHFNDAQSPSSPSHHQQTSSELTKADSQRFNKLQQIISSQV